MWARKPINREDGTRTRRCPVEWESQEEEAEERRYQEGDESREEGIKADDVVTRLRK